MMRLGKTWDCELRDEITLRGVGGLKPRNTTVLALRHKGTLVWKALVGRPKVSQQGVGELCFWGISLWCFPVAFHMLFQG
jgi:hypothetical protein